MSTPSKKRKVITLDVKKKIIEAAENKTSEELGKQSELPASSIRNILRDNILRGVAVLIGVKAKQSRLNHTEVSISKHNCSFSGIIQNLKVNYRGYLLHERIAAIDNQTDYKMDLLKALQFLRRSWKDVENTALANCFRKAGFIKNGEQMKQMDEEVQAAEGDENDQLDTLWAELQAMEMVEGDLGDYLAVDDQLATGGMWSLEEIAAHVSTTEVEEPEVESDTDVMQIDEEPELPPITNREAKEALHILQRYSSDPLVLQLCDKVNDMMAEERIKKLKP